MFCGVVGRSTSESQSLIQYVPIVPDLNAQDRLKQVCLAGSGLPELHIRALSLGPRPFRLDCYWCMHNLYYYTPLHCMLELLICFRLFICSFIPCYTRFNYHNATHFTFQRSRQDLQLSCDVVERGDGHRCTNR